jgi:lipopolysaccharide transport system permease protein
MDKVIIKAGGSELQYWKDIIRYADLLKILALRDVKVRYKQTLLGAAWGLVRPLFTLIGFAFVFTKIGVANTSSIPYPIIAFSGILMWAYFSNSFLQISNCLVANTNLISKVYFPRIIIPISAGFVVFVDFLMAFVLFAGLLLFYKINPSAHILLLPLVLFQAYILALGLGLIFSSLNVKYRDFGQIAPFIVQFGLFICPVAYSHESLNLSPSWNKLYNLNPVVGLIDTFRWLVLPEGYGAFPWESFIPSALLSLLFLTIGVWYFRKKENSFVDHI